jgi:hypothetical protein
MCTIFCVGIGTVIVVCESGVQQSGIVGSSVGKTEVRMFFSRSDVSSKMKLRLLRLLTNKHARTKANLASGVALLVKK